MRVGPGGGAPASAGARECRCGAGRRRVLVAVAADAEQTLLQLAVRRQLARLDQPVDAAVDHDGNGVGNLGGDADVLLDHKHRDLAVLGETHQDVVDLGDDDGGEALGRLVHHQQARVEQQSARDRHHLLLAARKLRAGVGLALGEPREGVVNALDSPGAAALAGNEPQVLVHRERAPQATTLRHVADAEAGDVGRRAAYQLLAAEADRAAGGAHQPHDGFAQRGLAHAVAAHHRQGTLPEREVDALQRVRATVEDVEAPDLQHGRATRAGTDAISHDRLRGKAPAPRRRTRSPRGGPP